MQQFMQGLYDICNTFSPFVYLLVAVSLIIIKWHTQKTERT